MNVVNLIKCVAAASAVAAFAESAETAHTQTEKENMKYTLTELEYPHDALEPWIDSATVGFHHDKHQAAYVDKLNAALASEPSFKFDGCVGKLIANLANVPASIRTAVRNNGGGVWNHEFYWRGLSPETSHPSHELLEALKATFGTFDNFKKQMSAAAAGQFGSGWAWLCVLPDGSLKICATPNQDSPVMGAGISTCAGIPILTIDVWEHAYYLKYQNRRPEYVDAIWNIVNWKRVSERYAAALKEGKVCL